MSGDPWLNPTVMAAGIAAIVTLMGAMFAARSKTAMSQVQGWDRYTAHLMKRVEDLEAEVRRRDQEHERELAELRKEMERRDEVCRARILELEARIR